MSTSLALTSYSTLIANHRVVHMQKETEMQVQMEGEDSKQWFLLALFLCPLVALSHRNPPRKTLRRMSVQVLIHRRLKMD